MAGIVFIIVIAIVAVAMILISIIALVGDGSVLCRCWDHVKAGSPNRVDLDELAFIRLGRGWVGPETDKAVTRSIISPDVNAYNRALIQVRSQMTRLVLPSALVSLPHRRRHHRGH